MYSADVLLSNMFFLTRADQSLLLNLSCACFAEAASLRKQRSRVTETIGEVEVQGHLHSRSQTHSLLDALGDQIR